MKILRLEMKILPLKKGVLCTKGELQAAEASLRVPLRIICIPLFNWIYAKGSEWGIPGLAHTIRGSWQVFSSEILIRLLFPQGVGEVIWK